MPRGIRTAAQSQKAVPAHLKSERLPLFGWARMGPERQNVYVFRVTHVGRLFNPSGAALKIVLKEMPGLWCILCVSSDRPAHSGVLI